MEIQRKASRNSTEIQHNMRTYQEISGHIRNLQKKHVRTPLEIQGNS
jgi:hypothetical protein